MPKEENPLTALLASIGEASQQVLPAIKATLESEANKVYRKMKDGTPRSSVEEGGHVHLQDTLVIKQVQSRGKWGFRIDYEGYREEAGRQVPYSMIARSLNKGSGATNFAPTHHIDQAVKSLKGLDGRLAQAAEQALEEGIKN